MLTEVDHYWTDKYMARDAERGSNGLLAALKEHHDFNVIPPFGWQPRGKKPAPAAGTAWFHIDEPEPKKAKIAQITDAVCRYFGLQVTELISRRKEYRIAYARQIAFFLATCFTSHSVTEIGRRIGGRDHSTVLHGVGKIERQIFSDWKVAYDVAIVESMI